jgi:N-acetylglucosaminyldiphosphoundecaprenol N-acetyl-beta-D-mannosaminyltransferase
MQTKEFLSIKISLGTYTDFIDTLIEQALSGPFSYTCVANVHMLIEAHRDLAFAAVVNNAAIVTPDGQPLTWGLKFLYGIEQRRVAGMDLLPDLLSAAEKKYIPVFFYGGTDTLQNATKNHLASKYPNLKIAGMYSPPFRPLSETEETTILNMINNSGARLVFVVLGCPKQEKWMASVKGKINSVMIGIGGALPVLIGLQKRSPKWMQKAGLEWFFRLCLEPRRLFKRYAITNTLFVYLVLKEKLSFKKYSKNT